MKKPEGALVTACVYHCEPWHGASGKRGAAGAVSVVTWPCGFPVQGPMWGLPVSVVPPFGSGKTAVGCGLPVGGLLSQAIGPHCACAWWVTTSGPVANSTNAAAIATVPTMEAHQISHLISRQHQHSLGRRDWYHLFLRARWNVKWSLLSGIWSSFQSQFLESIDAQHHNSCVTKGTLLTPRVGIHRNIDVHRQH